MIVLISALFALALPPSGRAVAFTFDDLPATRLPTLEDGRAITTGLLDQLETLSIPATGFVNETKLDDVPGEEAARTALLEAWLEAGHDLGNHTYSHRRLYDTPLPISSATSCAASERSGGSWRSAVVARGTFATLRSTPGRTSSPSRRSSASSPTAGIRSRRSRSTTTNISTPMPSIAPARVATRALMARIGDDYVRYMEEVFRFYERVSRELLGREPAQILLLHANALNAAYLDELAGMLAGRGYRFVTLDEALADPAYALPDRYVGPRGPSWLERWAFTRGVNPGAMPRPPAWIRTVPEP
jgi:peptidoglycan/xylan/chitin deacetylase (PgdA/CDA1 family)